MNGIVVANKIKDVLESVDDWTGRVYVYIPNVKSDQEYLDSLVDQNTDRVDVWFIRRSNIRSRKYGEAARTTPLGYRTKQHVFTIRGFQSVYDAGKIEDATSETDFQDRCDNIEKRFARTTSLGVSTHDVILTNLDIAIDYDSLSKALCHTAIITLTIEERLRTHYEL